jgi:hypothetical protein
MRTDHSGSEIPGPAHYIVQASAAEPARTSEVSIAP